MFVSFRSIVLVLASIASASVAPAQTIPGIPAQTFNSAPPVALASNELPRPVSPILVDPAEDAASAPTGEPAGDAIGSDSARRLANESLPALVGRLSDSGAASRERTCLATAIYFEAKSEPLAGQLAVGEVLANRVRSGRFASSFCGVVMQRGQFSFIHNKALPAVPHSSLQWRNAVAVATIVAAKLMHSGAPTALFFHAKHVSPPWRATRVATIGNHVFYR